MERNSQELHSGLLFVGFEESHPFFFVAQPVNSHRYLQYHLLHRNRPRNRRWRFSIPVLCHVGSKLQLKVLIVPEIAYKEGTK